MRGLLFAVLFCALSLILAETVATLLVKLELIHPHEHDEAHGLTMLFMLALYLGYAPRFPKDFQHHNDHHRGHDGD